MLVLPTEAADPSHAGGLKDGDVENQTANLAAVLVALSLGNVDQGRIINRLHESVAEKVHRNAKGANFF